MSDGTKLVSLVRSVRDVSSIRADGAYAWRTNAQFIEDIGSVPYLKPRKDAIGGSRGYPAWRSLMLRYNSDREVWLEEYRKRWIVESVFSSVKRRLGPYLFSRRAYTQRRELVMKFIVHDLILCARGR